jgi:hypothetical protein
MSASVSPGNFDAVTEELRRLRRLAGTALLVATVSTAVAVAALVASYHAAPQVPLERTPVATEPTTPTPSQLLSASVIEAERFILRGKTGQVRAELGVEPDERAELSLRAPDGTLRTVLATADANPRNVKTTSLLTMADADGKRRVSLFVQADGTPDLDLLDKEEDARAGLVVVDDRPFLVMTDKERRVTVHLGYPIAGGGGPALSLWDQEAQVRAVLGSIELMNTKTGATERTAESSLVLFDRENKVIFKAPQ